MAIVTATITVDFTANYAGDHRVCWRVQGSGDPYDCTTIVNCVGGGALCQAIFPADVNTTSCDGTVTFEGYVQATCEDVLSTNGRLAFTVDFIPNPTCLRWELACAFAPVASLVVETPGSGYLISDTVVITRDPLDFESPDAVANITAVGDGIINTLTGLLSGGLGYIATEVLTINGAAGAGATITIDSILPGGIIDTFTLTTNGVGYIGPFTFTGGSGVGADFDIVDGVDYDTFGSVLGITVTVPGNYSIPPVITITSATGSGVLIRALLEDCPARVNVGTDCEGGDQVDLTLANGGLLQPGESWATCLTSGPNPGGDQYIDTQVGCCIPEDTVGEPCTDHHFDNGSGGPVDVHFTGCDGDDIVLTVPDQSSMNACAIVGGVVDPGIPGFFVSDTGTPCT